MSKILTKEQAEEIGLSFYDYENGDYTYKATDGFCRLIRNRVDLLYGKNATYCFSDDFDYEYRTEDGYYHFIRNGIDLLDGLEAVECHFYDNDDCEYKTKDGTWIEIKKETNK